MNKEIDKFVDLFFEFEMEELENETKFLENYKKLKVENHQLREIIKNAIQHIKKRNTDMMGNYYLGDKEVCELLIILGGNPDE